jgi:hypothetical protein
MIDRPARDELLRILDLFLADRIDNHACDTRIARVVENTRDRTVETVAERIWGYYDDRKSHHVVLSKADWDGLQRLRLILSSNSHVREAKQWHRSQILAFMLLTLMIVVCLQLGANIYALASFVLFGLTSICLSQWNETRRVAARGGLANQLDPFISTRQMLRVRRSVPKFHKIRYPAYLEERHLRSSCSEKLAYCYIYIVWTSLAPVVLLFQALPDFVHVVEESR